MTKFIGIEDETRIEFLDDYDVIDLNIMLFERSNFDKSSRSYFTTRTPLTYTGLLPDT